MPSFVSHKYIKNQMGDECVNVTHVAGYGIIPMGRHFYVVAYANLLRATNEMGFNDGKTLFMSIDESEAKRVFESVIKFVRDSSQPFLDLSSFR